MPTKVIQVETTVKRVRLYGLDEDGVRMCEWVEIPPELQPPITIEARFEEREEGLVHQGYTVEGNGGSTNSVCGIHFPPGPHEMSEARELVQKNVHRLEGAQERDASGKPLYPVHHLLTKEEVQEVHDHLRDEYGVQEQGVDAIRMVIKDLPESGKWSVED